MCTEALIMLFSYNLESYLITPLASLEICTSYESQTPLTLDHDGVDLKIRNRIHEIR